MTSLTFLTAVRTPNRQRPVLPYHELPSVELTLADVVLASVSELDSLVLTGGGTGWDSGSEKTCRRKGKEVSKEGKEERGQLDISHGRCCDGLTLVGGDVDLDGRITCFS